MALACAGMLLGARGCGGVTDDRVGARDRTTKATCDRYDACGLIGTETGDAFATYDSCSVNWRAEWDSQWPVADCQGHINQMELSECLSAIGGTDCNAVDLFVTLLGKCPKAMVCKGASADGGQ